MKAPLARVWFACFVVYVALAAGVLAWLCEGRLDGWGLAIFIAGLIGVGVAPGLVLRVILRDRRQRWREGFRRIDLTISNASALSSLGVLISILQPAAAWSWLWGLGMGMAFLGVGTSVWATLRALPVDEPADGVGEA